MQAYRRVFEGRLEQLPAIHEFVDRATTELGLREDDAFACRLSVDEAATNAFEHAYNKGPGKVEIAVWREADSIMLCIRNWGMPFDPEAIAVPDVTRPLEERGVGGLGIFLMRRFMDEISYSFDPQEGNAVTMCRRLERAVEPEHQTVSEQ
jgi:anti-sigma regulatory factor (Ser/Thr protein kinase)